jgi:energy-coupling factor transport system permease protein
MMMIKYSERRTFLHGLNPLSKLSVVVAYCIIIFLFDSLAFELASLAIILLVAYAIRARPVLSLAMSKFTVTLVLWLVVMQAIFTPTGSVILTIPLHFFSISVTGIGLMKGFLMALRFLTIILISGLFVVTTDPARLVYSMMKAGIPYRYGFMLIIMMRFMPVFELEMSTVSNAQKMRGLDVDSGGVKQLIKSIRYTFLPLIVSALSKVDVLVVSMEGRAFGYKRTRTFIKKDEYSLIDKAIIVFSVAILVIIFVDSIAGWYPLPHLGA